MYLYALVKCRRIASLRRRTLSGRNSLRRSRIRTQSEAAARARQGSKSRKAPRREFKTGRVCAKSPSRSFASRAIRVLKVRSDPPLAGEIALSGHVRRRGALGRLTCEERLDT